MTSDLCVLCLSAGESKHKLASLTKGAAVAERHGGRMRELCTCPITHELMVDPVTASDGHVYEKAAIMRSVQCTI